MSKPAISPALHQRIAVTVGLFAVILSTFFIMGSYKLYNQTYDESAHIACGMQWLSEGTYDYETLHPPLARVATALLPYLDGARSTGNPDMLVEGNALLNLHGNYWKNLTLSRLGILPFFWFGCWLIFRFMSKKFGYGHASIAIFLFAFCPPVLAHAGLATTDAPLMTMFTWSLLSFQTFIELPIRRNAIVAGISLALASITKFTELPFFFFAATGLLLYEGLKRRHFPVPVRRLLLMAIMLPPIIWMGYRFSYGPIFTKYTTTPIDAVKLSHSPQLERHILTQMFVPADEFFRGLIMAKGVGSTGRESFLLGHVYQGGRWDFFPVAILTKTPIPLLLFLFAGVALFCKVPILRKNPNIVVLLLGIACPLLVGMAGSMNIGLRHVLPIYPFIAMLSAVAVAYIWKYSLNSSKWLLRGAVVLLLGWDALAVVWAAPDFIPYFNVIAEPHADHILVNSDLDWGQSLYQLAGALKQRHAQSVTLQYLGDPDINMIGLPSHTPLLAGERPSGWIAVSDTLYREEPRTYDWLARYPHSIIDHSIRLYYIPVPSARAGQQQASQH